MSEALPVLDMERRTGDFIYELMADCLNSPEQKTGFTLFCIMPDGQKRATVRIAAELVYDIEADKVT